MGAAASIPDTLDAEACKQLVGDKFDERKFDELKDEDGKISREVLLSLQESETLPETVQQPESSVENYIDVCLSYSESDKKSIAEEVLQAAISREKAFAKDNAEKGKESDYSKSFSGSAADTKAEKDFGKLMSEDVDNSETIESCDPTLSPVVTADDSARYEELRAAGKWMKLMGGAGCFMYIHCFTHETVALRPEDYADEDETIVEKEDPACGFCAVGKSDLMEEIAKTVETEKMTPLLIDNSEEGVLTTFFSYKSILYDLSGMGLPLSERRKKKIKPKDEMEKLRQHAVNAIKNGATLAVSLGKVDSSCNFNTLCKKDCFPIEMFQQGGKRILTPSFPAPRCAKMFREEDKEGGQVTFKEKFQLVLISTLTPTEVKSELANSLPMEHIKPIYVTF